MTATAVTARRRRPATEPSERVRDARPKQPEKPKPGSTGPAEPPAYASRCSIPCFETFARVTWSSIHSGASSSFSSVHAQPS